MKVMYTGTSDYRGYSKADFGKADVENGALKFPKNEPVEVSDELGKALLEHNLFKGEGFKEVKEDEVEASAETTATGETAPPAEGTPKTPANKSK